MDRNVVKIIGLTGFLDKGCLLGKNNIIVFQVTLTRFLLRPKTFYREIWAKCCQNAEKKKNQKILSLPAHYRVTDEALLAETK